MSSQQAKPPNNFGLEFKMNSTDMIEDITTKKKEIEAKLDAERQNLAWLKDTLGRSSHLAGNMCNILDSFEDHLCKLEDTILPIHKETMDLQRRQGNIDKTLTLLDEVLNYHNVSSSVTKIIEGGPTGFLNDYLMSMDKVEDAVRFFKINSPESIELPILKSLNDTGRELLSKEFRTLLTRHSKPVPPVTIHDMLSAMSEANASDNTSQTSVDDMSIDHLPERTMTELRTIAGWLTAHGTNTDFMSVYSQVRSSALKLSLQGIREGSSSGMNMASVTGRARATPTQINPKRPTRIRRDGRKGSTKAQDYNPAHRRQSAFPTVDAAIDEEENSEVTRFMTCTGALLKLMQSEKTLMQAVIPEEHQVPIFSHLLNETIQIHLADGDALCNSAKRLFAKLDHSAIQMILPVLKYLRSLSNDFDAILRMANVETRKKFFTVYGLFESTGYKAMYDFIEKLKETEKHITMPKDGTVHEVTTNVMVFLEDLVKFSETTGVILASKEDSSSRSSSNHDNFVANYISQALICLSRSLALKAKSYDMIGLQSIFMLNNYNYIIKSLEKTGLMSLLKQHGFPNLEVEYKETMEEETKQYEKSWNKVINHLLEVNAPLSQEKLAEAMSKGHLKDKYKQGIKDKFKGFNADFEDLKQVHRVYAMPDPELRTMLYERIANFVVPLYSTFLLRYRDVNFTKNPEKYIKYSFEDFKRNLITMYEVSSIVS